ncbi:MAG TPA: hypothetical protein VIV40_39350 [Kofleriaceae bacterium]
MCAVVFASACATGDGLPDGSDRDARVTRTVVTLHDDGTESVTQSEITVAEQQAELARNQALEEDYLSRPEGVAFADPPVRDGSCSWYSLKLFDGQTYTGNYICFTGNGFVNLGNYCRTVCAAGFCFCGGRWAGAVRAYWSGSNFGWYQSNGVECPADDFMPQYEARSTVSSCIQNANYVVMNYSKL